MRALLITVVVVATGCNKGPVLQNVPKPDPAVVAGAAAGVAAAATLADPQAAKKAEQRAAEAKKSGAAELRTRSQPTIPADVLDRMERPAADAVDAGVDAVSDGPRD